MNEPVQLTLDLMTSVSVPAKEDAADSNMESFSIPILQSFDFRSLFAEKCHLEEKHSYNSMAILGDCLDVLKHMKNKSVNLIFADAPYNIGKDFGNNQDKWENVQDYIEWCKNGLMSACVY